jgi:hypothetical protein
MTRRTGRGAKQAAALHAAAAASNPLPVENYSIWS